MTNKQQKFVDEYLRSPNARQAAILAGYSEKTADVKGSQLLKIAEIADAIKEGQEIAKKAAEVDKEWVLKRFKEISDRCMTAEPVMIFDGEAWVESGEYKFDSSGANKATEMIGKHIGFFEVDNAQRATQINVDSLSDDTLSELLKASKNGG